jgi:hypothetical protein
VDEMTYTVTLTAKELAFRERARKAGIPAIVVSMYAGALQRLVDKERQWVGLTKEEAKEISMANRPYVIDMIAALEARLKEKNGG